MSSWDDHRLTCMHGRREGLDSHDCPYCRELTDIDFGPEEPTRLYLKKPKTMEVEGHEITIDVFEAEDK